MTSRPDLTPGTVIAAEHPATADVRALLQRHFDLMRAGSPEESCHVMAPDALDVPGVHLFGLRQDGVLCSIGAFSDLGARHGELKSMHTAAEARGQGYARLLLRALIAKAQDAGMTRVSLETGSAPPFAAARALYASEGFTVCDPFGSYVHDPLSLFMTRTI